MLRPFRLLAPLLALAPALLAEAPKTPTPQLTFIRGQETPEKQSALQTLSAEFKPAGGNGPSVWLIGVAHLGTAEYYKAIQKRLDSQSSVLFEGVGAEKLKEGAKLDSAGGIQTQLAKSLGLEFQLDAIDYRRAHFVNSDLTVEGLQNAITERTEKRPAAKTDLNDKAPAANNGKEPATNGAKLPDKVDNETFNSLMDAIHGEGEMAESLGALVGLMGSTPEMRETTKLMLIEALGQAGEIIDIAKAASPDIKDLFEVLITERNEEVIRQLKAQLPKLAAGKSIAVFYGAAHMDEIARRLTTQLNYQPAAREWDTAFTADGSKSIMPPAQIKMMLQMMRTQLQNPAAGGGDSAGGFPLLNLLNPQGPAKAPAPKPAAK
jgi:hypothetical protein